MYGELILIDRRGGAEGIYGIEESSCLGRASCRICNADAEALYPIGTFRLREVLIRPETWQRESNGTSVESLVVGHQGSDC